MQGLTDSQQCSLNNEGQKWWHEGKQQCQQQDRTARNTKFKKSFGVLTENPKDRLHNRDAPHRSNLQGVSCQKFARWHLLGAPHATTQQALQISDIKFGHNLRVLPVSFWFAVAIVPEFSTRGQAKPRQGTSTL